nr:MAG TPA: hypothetical protein [Caudoviricetes sp.]
MLSLLTNVSFLNYLLITKVAVSVISCNITSKVFRLDFLIFP